MQLNKVVKGLMLALPIMALAACSSTDSSSDGSNGGAGGGYGTNGGFGSGDEQARLTLQQLQQQNVVYFDYDRYDVRSDFAQMLDAHAAFLRSNPSYKVTIEGHADERGTPEYNIALGERRANAVKMYLQGKGVMASKCLSYLTVKKSRRFWVTMKRPTLKTVAPYWFTKRAS